MKQRGNLNLFLFLVESARNFVKVPQHFPASPASALFVAAPNSRGSGAFKCSIPLLTPWSVKAKEQHTQDGGSTEHCFIPDTTCLVQPLTWCYNDYAFNYHWEDCWCPQQQFRQIWISTLRGERSVLDESSRERDWQHKLEHKEYADNKGGATDSSLAPGDKVLLRNTKASRKLTPNFESTPHAVLTNVNHVPNMADGRVFSAISHFDIPSSKKLHRTKSVSALSMVTDDSSS